MDNFALRPGTLLGEGRYQIEKHLAAGGFGMVYVALDTRRQERVAVKELFWREHAVRDEAGRVCLKDEKDAKEYASVRTAFDAEAKTLSRLADIPGIVHGRDAFEENGTVYIVMDEVTGTSLARLNKERARAKKPDAVKLIKSFLPLMESLARIHDAGIIHRDVSPENIVVSSGGAYTLIDFGSAGAYERDEGERFTTIAKDGFAPVEQYQDGARQGPYSDVYGLCATVYTCLTGVVPDSAKVRRMMDELKPPSALGVKMPRELEAVLMRGLEVNAAKRYADMRALMAAVRRALVMRAVRVARAAVLGALAAACIGLVAWQTAMFFSDDQTPAGNRIQATWENPVLMDAAGKNQVRAAAFQGETQAYLYTFYGTERATQGEREDLIRLLKARLDTLGTPYAFDADTDGSGSVAIRMAGEKISDFVLSTLTDNYLYVRGEDDTASITISYNRYSKDSDLTVRYQEDGGYALACTIGDDYYFEDMLARMQERGEDTLYLCDGHGHALAQAPVSALKDGVIVFTSLRFEHAQQMNADTRFMADYIHALVNTPPLPYTGTLEAKETLDQRGSAKKDVYTQPGMRLPRTPADQALVDVLKKIYEDTGYACTENSDGTLFISVDLPVDDTLPERAAQVTDQLLGGYPLSEQTYNHSLIITLIDEQEHELLRVALGRWFVLDGENEVENMASGMLMVSPRLEPYEEALNAWWEGLPDTYHGFGLR